MNTIERTLLLAGAQAAVRMLRDGGVTWYEIATKFRKRCNPLGLSSRQLERIYGNGPGRMEFDRLKNIGEILDPKNAPKLKS